MSVPEAKQYLLDGIENCQAALSALNAPENSKLENQKKALEEVLHLLEGLKEKVFFKTKKAVAPSFQVKETSEAVSSQADEIADADEDTLREFGEAVGHLKDAAATLEASSKTQSVIVT